MALLQRPHRTQLITFILISFSCWLLLGCRSNYEDLTRTIITQRLSTPVAKYSSVAWLGEDQIAFVYWLDEFGNREGFSRIAIHTLSTDNWRDITLPPRPERCYEAPSMPAHLHRLPNGNVGLRLQMYGWRYLGYGLYVG